MKKRALYTPQHRISVAGQKESGIYRAKLAEPYDGIGQYVSVALAGSSVAAAYKARVASGDFNGGRTFPAGTPVIVVVERGQVEVFLGNIPQNDIDNFDNRAIDCQTSPDLPEPLAWGETSRGGLYWRTDGGTVQDHFCVEDGYGRWTNEPRFPIGTGLNATGDLVDWEEGAYAYPPEIAGNGSLYVKFRFNTIGSHSLAHINGCTFHLEHEASDGNWDVFVVTTQRTTPGDNFEGRIQLDTGSSPASVRFQKTDWLSMEWYILEVNQSDDTVSASVYLEDDGPPDAYQVSSVMLIYPPFPWEHDVENGDSLNWGVDAGNVDEPIYCDTDRIWFRAL